MSKIRYFIIVFVALIVLVVSMSIVAGEEPVPEGVEAEVSVPQPAAESVPPIMDDAVETLDQPSVFDLIGASGIIGYVIIGVSFVLVALIIESFVSVRRERIIPPDLLGELEELFKKQEYDAALELCEVERNLLTNVVGAGLAKLNAGWTQMESAMEESAEEGATDLYQKIGYLNLIGNLSPMLGLLGTVWGMVQAFMVIANSGGTPKPTELAEGIYQALITTVEGLIVAIIAIPFYFFFRNRVAKMLLEAGAVTGELMERFRPRD